MPTEYVRDGRQYLTDPALQSGLKDDFESTLFKWPTLGTAGAGLNVARDATKAFDGLASMILTTKTAAPANGDNVNTIRYVQYPKVPNNVEFVGTFSTLDAIGSIQLDFIMNISKSGTMWIPRLQWSGAGWFYTNSAGSSVQLTSFPNLFISPLGLDLWHSFSIVYNMVNNQFVSLRFDNTIFNFTTPTSPNSAANANTFIYCTVSLTTLAAASKNLWVDNVAVNLL